MLNPSAWRVTGLHSQIGGRSGEPELHSVAAALTNFGNVVNSKAGLTPS